LEIEIIPEGERSDVLRQDGPWFEIRFRNGRHLTLSDDNEGCTPDEVNSIAAYIADRSFVPLKKRKDSQPRR
jgi:hypothetical protein